MLRKCVHIRFYTSKLYLHPLPQCLWLLSILRLWFCYYYYLFFAVAVILCSMFVFSPDLVMWFLMSFLALQSFCCGRESCFALLLLYYCFIVCIYFCYVFVMFWCLFQMVSYACLYSVFFSISWSYVSTHLFSNETTDALFCLSCHFSVAYVILQWSQD